MAGTGAVKAVLQFKQLHLRYRMWLFLGEKATFYNANEVV
jgi:hypothetical protein